MGEHDELMLRLIEEMSEYRKELIDAIVTMTDTLKNIDKTLSEMNKPKESFTPEWSEEGIKKFFKDR